MATRKRIEAACAIWVLLGSTALAADTPCMQAMRVCEDAGEAFSRVIPKPNLEETNLFVKIYDPVFYFLGRGVSPAVRDAMVKAWAAALPNLAGSAQFTQVSLDEQRAMFKLVSEPRTTEQVQKLCEGWIAECDVAMATLQARRHR